MFNTLQDVLYISAEVAANEAAIQPDILYETFQDERILEKKFSYKMFNTFQDVHIFLKNFKTIKDVETFKTF